ncbi:MAG: hypothetical protein ACLUSX_00365, partial [Ruminococcus sp.]|uniref:hypothetical protein n=1 Tax=Ruminococcus sp. TaxID=41978 RepID=UPI0039941D3F
TTTVRFRAVALNALLRREAERAAEVHAFLHLDTPYNDYYLLAAGEITTEQPEAKALVVEMLQQCGRPGGAVSLPPAIPHWSSAISSTISTCI